MAVFAYQLSWIISGHSHFLLLQVHGLRNVGEEWTPPVGITEAYLTNLRIVPVRKTRLFFCHPVVKMMTSVDPIEN